ncbi:hypothetical protein M378DRAFT_171822 [Amanita muscaria Koide BX008]|uniref:Uncharacterized protein n=1 Tax=Amanita muscaria (strain Koide BX008) TaxID=946122 RepID=A0A0C2STM4_AMAMK|nr:hypothetical protein M378DRAFT_171822 [Amanita muscaria Koide BX008]
MKCLTSFSQVLSQDSQDCIYMMYSYTSAKRHRAILQAHLSSLSVDSLSLLPQLSTTSQKLCDRHG